MKILKQDPRLWQILVLGVLLFGFGIPKWGLELERIMLIISTSFAVQALMQWKYKIPFDLRSSLITAFSLSLLFRANSNLILSLFVILAVASKFLIRIQGKHLFNPANFAIAIGLLFMPDEVWISPGQWGSDLWLAFFFCLAGAFVAGKSWRLDISVAFLITVSFMVFQRSWFLGDPIFVPIHKLSSGALLLFTFFMISDPRTTPNARFARIIFGVCVGLLAYWINFKLFIARGPILALFFLSPLIPIFDLFFKKPIFHWQVAARGNS